MVGTRNAGQSWLAECNRDKILNTQSGGNTIKNSHEKTPLRRAPMPQRYVINPPFQIRVLLYLFCIVLIVVVSTTATVNYLFYDFVQEGHELGLPAGNIFFQFIEKQQLIMNQLLAGLFVFLSFLIIVSGMILSHRVAGPIHRLNQHMQGVALGQIAGPVHFREQDFFKELAESYNAQYEALQKKSHKNTEKLTS